MTADQTVERAANKLQQLANRLAGESGLKSKLAQPLAEDADLIRKLKPSLITARARGARPKAKKSRGPTPWIVVGAALVAGIVLAKWIDRRGHGDSRD
jgi:hypothetical protein